MSAQGDEWSRCQDKAALTSARDVVSHSNGEPLHAKLLIWFIEMSLETIAPGSTRQLGETRAEVAPSSTMAEMTAASSCRVLPVFGEAHPVRRSVTSDRPAQTPSPTRTLNIEQLTSAAAVWVGSQKSRPDDRPEYTIGEKIAILYLHVMLEHPWSTVVEMYNEKLGGERTIQGLQSSAYRLFEKWGMRKSREEPDVKKRKAFNKKRFKERTNAMEQQKWVEELGRTYGPPKGV